MLNKYDTTNFKMACDEIDETIFRHFTTDKTVGRPNETYPFRNNVWTCPDRRSSVTQDALENLQFFNQFNHFKSLLKATVDKDYNPFEIHVKDYLEKHNSTDFHECKDADECLGSEILAEEIVLYLKR